MKNQKSLRTILLIVLLFALPFSIIQASSKDKKKTIYFSYTLHGNMNYDRYPKSTIWKEFPATYQNILDFIKEHPDFKGQMQLSGQTFKTLQLVMPEFLEDAKKAQEKGIIDITGTFYSEPVNVCIDGETNLTNASLGTAIINRELVPSSGYFLQESAYNPQIPFILTEAGVDWTPVRFSEHRYNKPFYAIGLDGTKIVAVQEILRHSKEIYQKLIENAPDNSLFLIGGDYEMPERFIEGYFELIELDKENPDVTIEWIRVSDYLKKHKPEGEVFVNNSDLAAITNWDSYSRWTTDPYDIEIHTITKQAMNALRAAKMAVYAGAEFAKANNLKTYEFSDLPVEKLQSFEDDKGIDWDIEHASSYPSVEPGYLKRNGEVTMLSRAEHLLAWAVNSDSRGWWPLYERRQERIESFQEVIDISEELIQNSLSQLGSYIATDEKSSRSVMVFNAEKGRTVDIEITANAAYKIMDANGNEIPARIFRKGNDFYINASVELPGYGYKVLSLKEGGVVSTPTWIEGNSVSNSTFTLTAKDESVELKTADGRLFDVSVDSFQLKVLAEMIFIERNIKDWHYNEPYGPTRVTVCNDGLNPKIRVDRQIDWTIHLRQEYELKTNYVNCKWDFFMAHPTLIRKDGTIDKEGASVGQKREYVFKPEGLMARVKTSKPGKVFYDVPFGITDHNFSDSSYITMLNFALLQQPSNGVMLIAKTGTQAVAVNQKGGEMALTLGASNGSGPIRNPIMTVDGFNIYHERPMYAEVFKGWYKHEFAIYPFSGRWNEVNAQNMARAYANDVFLFGLHTNKHNAKLSGSESLIQLDNDMVEITTIDKNDDEFFIRLNERVNSKSKGNVKVGEKSFDYSVTGFQIKKIRIE
jgi:hypothetical protein